MGPQFFVDGGFVCTYKGITRLLGRGSVRITPAHAGKRCSCSSRPWRRWDHPRTRGEKAFHWDSSFRYRGSPPHTRGKAQLQQGCAVQVGITPAHAGKSKRYKTRYRKARDHPRTRGEKPIVTGDIDVLEGSPPRVRGKETAYRFYIWPDGITPAHAGKSWCRLSGPL